MRIQLVAFNCRYSHSCLALFYVRNELERNMSACSAAIQQFTINDPYYETLLRVSGLPADALFFSAYIWNATYLGCLLTDLHRLAPHLPIVLGGPQAVALRETLSFRPTVVHQQVEGLDQAFYRDLAAGALQGDYQAAPVADFGCPYRPEDFQAHLNNRNIYYESSRGCPFFCTYCLSSISRGVVNKGLDTVKEELRAILAHGPKIIRFVDRTFNADQGRALAIWRFLAEQAPDGCAFHFEIAPDLFNEEMFRFLEGIRAGLFQFEIGIQSTSPQTLQAINRKMDLAKSFATIERLQALGTIHLHIDLILGLPTETKEVFAQSLKEVMALQPHYVQMGLLKVLPDTEICKHQAVLGIVACREPPYQVMATRWLDHETLAGLYWLGECVEAFYNKGYFKTFFSYLLTHGEDIFVFFEELTTACLGHDFFTLAKTQELMNSILFAFIEGHPKRDVLREILIFDWLRCGHRFLPALFQVDLTGQRNLLWQQAADEIPGLYDMKARNFFFKRGVFCRFSAALLAHCRLAPGGAGGYVGFFTEESCKEKRKTQAVVIPLMT